MNAVPRPKAPITTLALSVAIAVVSGVVGAASMYVTMIDRLERMSSSAAERLDRVEARLRAADDKTVGIIIGRLDIAAKDVEARVTRVERRFDETTRATRDDMIRMQATVSASMQNQMGLVVSSLQSHMGRVDARLVNAFKQLVHCDITTFDDGPVPPEAP